MPIRRTLGKRKRVGTARRNVRRRMMRRKRLGARMTMNVRSKPFFFKRWTGTITATTNTSAGLTFSASGGVTVATLNAATPSSYYWSQGQRYQLTDIPNVTELSTLFDRYRICGISYKFLPFSNDPATASLTSNSGSVGLLIHSALDWDDDSAPAASDAGIDVLRQYPSYRVVNMAQKRVFKRFIKPKMLLSSVNSAGTYAGNRVVRSSYVDMASVVIPHYGHKMVLEWYSPTNASVTYNFKQEITYYFACRDLR